MSWQKWVLLAVMALSVITTILMIGRPRAPITPAIAVFAALFNGGLAALVVFA